MEEKERSKNIRNDMNLTTLLAILCALLSIWFFIIPRVWCNCVSDKDSAVLYHARLGALRSSNFNGNQDVSLLIDHASVLHTLRVAPRCSSLPFHISQLTFIDSPLALMQPVDSITLGL